MARVTYRLPLPPTTNNLFAHYGSKRYINPQYAAWLRAAGWELQGQRAGSPCPLIEGDVQAIVLVRRPSKRADLDNRLKAVFDLLVRQAVIRDDTQIVRIAAAWGDVEGCEVTVESVHEDAKPLASLETQA